MASAEAVLMATKVIATGAGVTGATYNDGMIQFLASQLDAAASLIEEMNGTPSTERVMLVLAKKGLGLTNLSDNYAINCGGSLLSLGFSIALASGEASTGVGLPAAIITAAGILADGYSTYTSCVVPAIAPATAWYTQIILDFCSDLGIPAMYCY
jgi:hypothetical protein